MMAQLWKPHTFFLKTPDQLYEFAEVNLIANVSRQDRHLCILNTIYPMTNISALCSIKSTTILRDCFKAKYKKRHDNTMIWQKPLTWRGRSLVARFSSRQSLHTRTRLRRGTRAACPRHGTRILLNELTLSRCFALHS